MTKLKEMHTLTCRLLLYEMPQLLKQTAASHQVQLTSEKLRMEREIEHQYTISQNIKIEPPTCCDYLEKIYTS